MELQTIIDERVLSEEIPAICQRLRSLAPAMKLVGQALLESIDDTFDAEGRPAAWQPLSELTLKGKGEEQKILEGETHRLREGIHVQGVGADYVDIAPDDLPYARIEQLGGKAGRGLQTVIPARPYLVVQEHDSNRIKNIITDFIMP